MQNAKNKTIILTLIAILVTLSLTCILCNVCPNATAESIQQQSTTNTVSINVTGYKGREYNTTNWDTAYTKTIEVDATQAVSFATIYNIAANDFIRSNGSYKYATALDQVYGRIGQETFSGNQSRIWKAGDSLSIFHAMRPKFNVVTPDLAAYEHYYNINDLLTDHTSSYNNKNFGADVFFAGLVRADQSININNLVARDYKLQSSDNATTFYAAYLSKSYVQFTVEVRSEYESNADTNLGNALEPIELNYGQAINMSDYRNELDSFVFSHQSLGKCAFSHFELNGTTATTFTMDDVGKTQSIVAVYKYEPYLNVHYPSVTKKISFNLNEINIASLKIESLLPEKNDSYFAGWSLIENTTNLDDIIKDINIYASSYAGKHIYAIYFEKSYIQFNLEIRSSFVGGETTNLGNHLDPIHVKVGEYINLAKYREELNTYAASFKSLPRFRFYGYEVNGAMPSAHPDIYTMDEVGKTQIVVAVYTYYPYAYIHYPYDGIKRITLTPGFDDSYNNLSTCEVGSMLPDKNDTCFVGWSNNENASTISDLLNNKNITPFDAGKHYYAIYLAKSYIQFAVEIREHDSTSIMLDDNVLSSQLAYPKTATLSEYRNDIDRYVFSHQSIGKTVFSHFEVNNVETTTYTMDDVGKTQSIVAVYKRAPYIELYFTDVNDNNKIDHQRIYVDIDDDNKTVNLLPYIDFYGILKGDDALLGLSIGDQPATNSNEIYDSWIVQEPETSIKYFVNINHGVVITFRVGDNTYTAATRRYSGQECIAGIELPKFEQYRAFIDQGFWFLSNRIEFFNFVGWTLNTVERTDMKSDKVVENALVSSPMTYKKTQDITLYAVCTYVGELKLTDKGYKTYINDVKNNPFSDTVVSADEIRSGQGWAIWDILAKGWKGFTHGIGTILGISMEDNPLAWGWDNFNGPGWWQIGNWRAWIVGVAFAIAGIAIVSISIKIIKLFI